MNSQPKDNPMQTHFYNQIVITEDSILLKANIMKGDYQIIRCMELELYIIHLIILVMKDNGNKVSSKGKELYTMMSQQISKEILIILI